MSWNANAEPDLSGYRVYYGVASGVYSDTLDIGNRTSWRLGGLTGGQTYYIAVSAYDRASNESGRSSEVSAKPESGAPQFNVYLPAVMKSYSSAW